MLFPPYKRHVVYFSNVQVGTSDVGGEFRGGIGHVYRLDSRGRRPGVWIRLRVRVRKDSHWLEDQPRRPHGPNQCNCAEFGSSVAVWGTKDVVGMPLGSWAALSDGHCIDLVVKTHRSPHTGERGRATQTTTWKDFPVVGQFETGPA